MFYWFLGMKREREGGGRGREEGGGRREEER